jgi:hypothetical protein
MWQAPGAPGETSIVTYLLEAPPGGPPPHHPPGGRDSARILRGSQAEYCPAERGAFVILQRRQAVPASTCERLIEIFEGASAHASRRDYSGFPLLHVFKDDVAPQARAFVAEVLAARRLEIAAGLPTDLEYLHFETVILTALGVGGCHPWHADNAKLEDGQWVPNHTPHRHVSALLYLNDDFEGGEIVFDAQQIEIRPEPGMLVAFPSSFEYPHEVRPVTRGRRISMPFWFTPDSERALSMAFTQPMVSA